MLALEGLAVLLMVLLYALPGHASAWHIDHAQLTLAGVTAKQIRGGLVLGVFAFVGFESAASLGGEVANPLRNIPRAISSSILIGGLFFIVSAYAEQIAFGANSSTLATSTAPLKLLAAIRGYPAFGPLLMTWCCVSAVACVAACIQAAARTLYGMSCNGQCAAILGRIHPRRHSPHIAILATTAAIALPAAALILLGLRLFDVYNWLATFATLGFITAYALVTIAAVRVQITLRTFGILSAITAAVIACVLALGAASSFDPSLTGVDRLLPYLYLLALAAGVLLTIAQRRPTQVS
jgi:amino acid transporter